MFALNSYFESNLLGILTFLDFDIEPEHDLKLMVDRMVDHRELIHTSPLFDVLEAALTCI